MAKKVVVLGSWHSCIFANNDRIPLKGETVTGNSYFMTLGGKGANQACACGLLGGNCKLIQNLGDDDFGRESLKVFEQYHLSTEYVKLVPGEHTGLALIAIDKNGENAIMVIPGAHGHYTKIDIDHAEEAFNGAFMAGFVLEPNFDMVEYGIKKAHAMGVQVFLDPTPAVEHLPDDIYRCLTYLKPNEHEASLLSGINVTDYDSAVKAGQWFLGKGVKNVIITMGGGGSVLINAKTIKQFPAPDVKVVDTTTAGDIYAGTFLYALSVDMLLEDAILFATCAGSLAVTKPGAMESAASLDEVTELYHKFKKSLSL